MMAIDSNDRDDELIVDQDTGGGSESTVSSDVTPLTTVFSTPNTVRDDTLGFADMTDDPRLEQAFALIRAVIADADKRAASDLVARISGSTLPSQRGLLASNTDEYQDKRAPRGSAAILIDRALAEAGEKGLTVLGIQSKAETDFERMVTTSAIRNWLKENERKKPPRYRQVGGVWFLAANAPTMKLVGS
jgi:hypothetical protein